MCTLRCYFAGAQNNRIYALTTGHVIAGSEDNTVYAPAETPYAEALKSLEVAIRQSGSRNVTTPREQKYHADYQKLLHYECRFGTVVFSDIRTVRGSHPAERYDIGVIKVETVSAS